MVRHPPFKRTDVGSIPTTRIVILDSMRKIVYKFLEEYNWLKFVDKHTTDLIEDEQIAVLNEMAVIGLTFSERFKLFTDLTLYNKMFYFLTIFLVFFFTKIADRFCRY